MLPLEEVQERILAAVPSLPAESVHVAAAHRRYLAHEIKAAVNLPAFDNSAMDGYAVRAQDLQGATAEQPIRLKLAGRLAAGEPARAVLAPGECVRVFTGSPLPGGSDAVVMQEDTRVEPQDPGQIHFLDSVKPWENLRFQGEDVKAGAVLAAPGTRLTARHLGLMAAAGVAELSVHRQPVVGLLATGNELVEPGSPLGAGQIYESNRVLLAPLLRSAGAVTRVLPIVADTLEQTQAALVDALAQCDAVITSGGVSVGELDFVKPALTALGGRVDVWQVAVKPGKPFVFGQWRDRFLFGLPGNPVSALVTYLLLVRPALAKWQGGESKPRQFTGELAEALNNPGNRRHFVRVRLDSQGQVHSAGRQASHHLASLTAADGLVDVPPATQLLAGTRVQVQLFED